MNSVLSALALVFLLLQQGSGGPRTLQAYSGSTPKIDGMLSRGEWDDATRFTGVLNWSHTFTATTDPKDLAVTGYVKHDLKRLYFSFDVTDDLLHGIDTPRWLPPENPSFGNGARFGY